jgi:hypothetical protein
MTTTERLLRRVSNLVHKTANQVGGDDCMEGLVAEAHLLRALAHDCASKVEMCKALGLFERG